MGPSYSGLKDKAFSSALWPVLFLLGLLWGVWQAAWTIDEHFVGRREFDRLCGRVEAIARHLNVPE